MGLFDKVSGFVKREAEDIGEAAGRARDRLDQELTEREEELEMTPAEKLRALQRKARQTDDRVDEIMEKAGASTAAADAAAEVAAAAAPPVDREPPSVTQIVLADGSVRSGDDPGLTANADEAEEEDPDEGDLSWVAPREGEEAVVPAFSAAVGAAQPSGAATEAQDATDETPAVETPALEAPAPEPPLSGDAAPVDAGPADPVPADPAPEAAAVDQAVAAAAAVAPPEPTPESAPTIDDPPAVAVAETVVDAAHEDLPPPPPPPMPEPAPAPVAEPAPAVVAEEAPRRETPAEIAARVVAELEQAVAEDPAPAPAPVAPTVRPEPTFDKTPAQRKYEEARKAADALLEELRGELRDDGEI